MAYKHGVYTSEVATSIVPAVNTTAGLPVVYGTAPLHLASDPADVNKPTLCYSYSEAVAAFGYCDDWENYTLAEVIYSQFSLYGVSPIVLVNVLDPSKHVTSVEEQEYTLDAGSCTITDAVLTDTLVVAAEAGGDALEAGTDYEFAHDDDGNLVITVLEGGALEEAAGIFASYTALDPSAVDYEDIIGGVNVDTGALTGLETLDQVFPLYGLVPGILAAPGWSDNNEVAAVMATKAGNINSHFKCSVFVDLPCGSDGVTKYSDASAWKNKYNYTGEDMAVCWPMVTMGSRKYHLSTHLMGVCGQTDADNDDVPVESPSNKTAQIDGMCLADGTEVILDVENASYLNGQGIITCLNFIGSWKIWGNRTGCYPSNTDAKDAFLCIRRMFNWHAQTFIQTYWTKVDKPITRRLIQTIVDSENIRLNGLVAQGALLGGRIEFLEDENPTTDLLDGIITFHTYLTPPTPARVIENTIEYDPEYFSALFS